MTDYVVFNGEFYPVNQVPISFNNRAFRYGDAIFETIKCNGHYPLYFNLHYKRLIKAMLSIKMDVSSLPREKELEDIIVKLLRKNKSYSSSRLRLEVFRDGQGLYTPTTDSVSFIMESTELPSINYQINPKGLIVDVYTEMQKQYSPVSFFKNSNALLYILAACYKKENKLDDCLLINTDSKIIEANSSNLFWVKSNEIFTPSVFTGCIDGVMRNIVIDIINDQTDKRIIETQGASAFELTEADEIFFTNAIQGIQWVVGFKEKRYFNQVAKKITKLLNDNTFNS